jgi:hypothetical protein
LQLDAPTTMTITSAARRRRPTRDPEDDVETRVYVRPTMPWDRLMVVQIMRDLERVGGRPDIAPTRSARASARPNVFLTAGASDAPPPWAHTRRGAASRELLADGDDPPEETALRRWRHQAPRRMLLPWFLFLTYFLIAFGVGQDPVLRRQTVSQLRAAGAEGAVVVQSSAIRLWRVVRGLTS